MMGDRQMARDGLSYKFSLEHLRPFYNKMGQPRLCLGTDVVASWFN